MMKFFASVSSNICLSVMFGAKSYHALGIMAMSFNVRRIKVMLM